MPSGMAPNPRGTGATSRAGGQGCQRRLLRETSPSSFPNQTVSACTPTPSISSKVSRHSVKPDTSRCDGTTSPLNYGVPRLELKSLPFCQPHRACIIVSAMTNDIHSQDANKTQPASRRRPRRQLRVEELMVFLGNEQAVRLCQ